MPSLLETQEQVIASLPDHLQPFAAYQDYSQYTARDHAVWRFLLYQLRQNLSSTAQPTYLDGLTQTGISLECIPRIEDINACLHQLGWRAVVVDGFLPPAIFMEFQALRVLVIAVNMRSFEHMLYTPAPDIVHESAGHAPFLIDIDYAEFLQRFGELGMRAVSNSADFEVYEAIRNLSIVKETTDASAQDISAAQQRLDRALADDQAPSESALLARLHWWTVEYGLVGNLRDYYIYGAGLLSSLGESVHCVDDSKVEKKLLTIDAIETAYDITTEQPQLFVTESCRHLSQVLEEYARHMCCSRGGVSALEEAQEAATVTTIRTNSGVQVSGKVSRVIKDAVGNVVYYNTNGPTQLAYQNQQLPRQGIDYHAHGFGSPIGRLMGYERCLSSYTVDELKRHQLSLNEPAELVFLSGVRVKGTLAGLLRREQKNLLLSFTDCTVTDRNGEILFDPEWGIYDMAVGDSVVSVNGGSADQRYFPLYQAPSKTATGLQHYDEATRIQFELYQKLRDLRNAPVVSTSDVADLSNAILALAEPDWLLLFEALELWQQDDLSDSDNGDIPAALRDRLMQQHALGDEDQKTLIDYGLARW